MRRALRLLVTLALALELPADAVGGEDSPRRWLDLGSRSRLRQLRDNEAHRLDATSSPSKVPYDPSCSLQQYHGCAGGCNAKEDGTCDASSGSCICGPGLGGRGCRLSKRAVRLAFGGGASASQPLLEGPALGVEAVGATFARLNATEGCSPPQLIVQVDCSEGAAQLWASRLQDQGTGVLLALSSQEGGGGWPVPGRMRAAAKGAGNPASSPYLIRAAAHPDPLSAARELFNQLGVMADVLHVCTPPFRAPSGHADVSPYVRHLGLWLDLLAPGGVFLAPDDPDRVAALALTELGLSSWPVAEAAPQKLGPSLTGDGSASAEGEREPSEIPAPHIMLQAPGPEPWPHGWVPDNVSVEFPNVPLELKVVFDTHAQMVTCNFSWTHGIGGGQWGNLMGPYVQCLSVAQLLGYTFQYGTSFDDHWLRHLPRLVEPGLVRANPSEVKRALDVCAPKFWAYPHECLYGWRAAKPAVEHVIRQAFFRWLKKTGNQLQAFEPTDALIQLRCAKDTLLDHWNYGPAAFSYYLRHLPPGTRRVFALYARHGHLSPKRYEPCERIVEALGAHLTAHRPGVEFSVVGGALWEDFGRLLTAPTVFAEGSSSLGLWVTLANMNRAFHPPFLAPIDGAEFGALSRPRIHPRYQVVDANILYRITASRLNITVDQVDRIIEWLEEN